MSLTVGAEFAGYGGAELGLSQVLDLEPLWFVEFDEAPSRVLAHHWPDAPNYGDITAAGLSLLPTPDVGEGHRGSGMPPSRTQQLHLADIPHLLPTPRAQARDSIYAREDHHNNLEEILGYIIEGRHDEIAREPVSYCPVCGEPIDYCLGHGPIADPDSLALLPTRRVGAVTA